MKLKKISTLFALSLTILAAGITTPAKAQEFTISIPDGVVKTAQLTGYSALALSSVGVGGISLYYLYHRAKEKFSYNYSFIASIIASVDAAATVALLPAGYGAYVGVAGVYDVGSKAFAALTGKNKQ